MIAAAKKCLGQILSEAFSAPLIDPDEDPLIKDIRRIGAAGPYRSLRLLKGGATALPAQPLPALRPRRPLW
jgi:hypothetical protein